MLTFLLCMALLCGIFKISSFGFRLAWNIIKIVLLVALLPIIVFGIIAGAVYVFAPAIVIGAIVVALIAICSGKKVTVV